MEKEKHNECYTYFSITGDFDVKEITEILKLKPFRYWNKDDVRKDGKPYGFSCVSFCRIDEYDPYITKQMEIVVNEMSKKTKELELIREKYNVKFYLTSVPSFYVNSIIPSVSPSMMVIDFCSKTRTMLDIDQYIYE